MSDAVPLLEWSEMLRSNAAFLSDCIELQHTDGWTRLQTLPREHQSAPAYRFQLSVPCTAKVQREGMEVASPHIPSTRLRQFIFSPLPKHFCLPLSIFFISRSHSATRFHHAHVFVSISVSPSLVLAGRLSPITTFHHFLPIHQGPTLSQRSRPHQRWSLLHYTKQVVTLPRAQHSYHQVILPSPPPCVSALSLPLSWVPLASSPTPSPHLSLATSSSSTPTVTNPPGYGPSPCKMTGDA